MMADTTKAAVTKEAASDVDLEGNQSAEAGVSIRNWLEGQENPRFEPKLHLRKVNRYVPDLENQLEKLKANREESERNRILFVEIRKSD